MQIQTTPLSVPATSSTLYPTPHTELLEECVLFETFEMEDNWGTFITGAQHIAVGSTAKFNLDGRDFTAENIRDYDR